MSARADLVAQLKTTTDPERRRSLQVLIDALPKPAVTRNKKVGKYNPDYKGKLLYPFFPVPLVAGRARGKARERVEDMITELLAAMPHPALLVYLAGCRTRDRKFVFSMSANDARAARGITTRSDKGDEYLRLLIEAGMIEQVLSGGVLGGTKVASAYRLLPWSLTMQDKASRAFAAYRNRARSNDPTRGHPDRARSRRSPESRLRAQSTIEEHSEMR